ncbi:uncharacterized protein MONBRDRAFT_12474 [Monosiga brevicollis MX1]|uniref:Uncharacterized protein n=1 Tax=Monosiga brevicollis TaxID=81824 RepID=A9VCD5_MONBE|nr:uncharacterized protein MONBRDRAFT_12474 [Monosiga brevicollis MX1]EDQ84881.1 predicted protein [Monosiga brevicollis MX1]|eukprot:XP_001750382.1 hypothetical protein [Monosiga brevicollis MX1]
MDATKFTVGIDAITLWVGPVVYTMATTATTTSTTASATTSTAMPVPAPSTMLNSKGTLFRFGAGTSRPHHLHHQHHHQQQQHAHVVSASQMHRLLGHPPREVLRSMLQQVEDTSDVKAILNCNDCNLFKAKRLALAGFDRDRTPRMPEPDIELVAFIPLLHKAILDSNVLGARRVGSVCNHVDRRLVVTEQHGLEDGV